MYGLTSVFDGWHSQVRGWPSDDAGGMCAWEFLDTRIAAHKFNYIKALARYIATRYNFDLEVVFKCERSLLPVKGFPMNVFIYANDILKLDIEEFKTCDL